MEDNHFLTEKQARKQAIALMKERSRKRQSRLLSPRDRHKATTFSSLK